MTKKSGLSRQEVAVILIGAALLSVIAWAAFVRPVSGQTGDPDIHWRLIAGTEETPAEYVAKSACSVLGIWGWDEAVQDWRIYITGATDIPGVNDLKYLGGDSGYWVACERGSALAAGLTGHG